MPDNDHFSVTSKHICYRRKLLYRQLHPDFPFFEAVPRSISSAIWLSEVWLPAPEAIRQVVLMVAGQQGVRYWPFAQNNIATGQLNNWRQSARRVSYHEQKISRQSLLGQIMADGQEQAGRCYGFRPEDTLLLAAFDSGFNYLLTVKEKDSLQTAYLQWIVDRLGQKGKDVERIYLCGTSRGGCLSIRLAKSLLEDSRFSDSQLLVSTIEAVANPLQCECNTRRDFSKQSNPFNDKSNYFAYLCDMNDYFPEEEYWRLKMLQLIGGESVLPAIGHAFIPEETPKFDYTCHWHDATHRSMGRQWHKDISGRVLEWLYLESHPEN